MQNKRILLLSATKKTPNKVRCLRIQGQQKTKCIHIYVNYTLFLYFLSKNVKILDCFREFNELQTCSDSSCCKRTRIPFPFSLKRHRFCKVSNAFPTSTEVGLATGSPNISIPTELTLEFLCRLLGRLLL